MTLTRQQACATRPTRSGIYIGRPPRSRLITPTAASHRRRCIARAVQGAQQRSWALRASTSHDAHDGMRHGLLLARRVEPGRSASAASCQRQALQRHAWQPLSWPRTGVPPLLPAEAAGFDSQMGRPSGTTSTNRRKVRQPLAEARTRPLPMHCSRTDSACPFHCCRLISRDDLRVRRASAVRPMGA